MKKYTSYPMINIKKIINYLHKFENSIAFIAILLLALFPTLEVIARKAFRTGIPSSSEYIQHLVLIITFIGGMITSRENKHLAITAGVETLTGRAKKNINIITAVIAATVSFTFSISSLSMIFIAFDPNRLIGFIPIQFIASIIPIGFFFMAVRFITLIDIDEKIHTFLLLFLAIILALLFSLSPIINILYSFSFNIPVFINSLTEISLQIISFVAIPLIIFLMISAIFGTPIFISLGGISYLLFIQSAGSLEIISNEAYTMLISHSIPAIPLFTIAGFILSESKAGERLVNVFKSFLGWMPGGMVIMVVLVCTFFTTFTGASGVTILALGGLLSYVLLESGKYSKKFTHGILTASGSIGLLFPPSLPIILYGVVAQISIKKMFVGGIIPGFAMVLLLSIYSVIVGYKNQIAKIPFNLKNALHSIRESIWELLLPVIILIGYFGGLTTIVETGAIAVVYSLIVAVFVHKDFKIRDLSNVMLKSIPIIGGVLVILAISRGLSYFIVDAEIPMNLTTWAKAHIHSKYVFLILLNLALLITGCLMDIFSAIMVVVPLIIPLGELYGIHPVHLGIIFLANLELGYLTPPVGLNLFLASYRFNQPLTQIYKNVLPFFFVLLVSVLLITYVPWISTVLLDLINF